LFKLLSLTSEKSRGQQQARFDAFVEHYNHERPRALGMTYPAGQNVGVKQIADQVWQSASWTMT
jgi:hypothetical protein